MLSLRTCSGRSEAPRRLGGLRRSRASGPYIYIYIFLFFFLFVLTQRVFPTSTWCLLRRWTGDPPETWRISGPYIYIYNSSNNINNSNIINNSNDSNSSNNSNTSNNINSNNDIAF